MDIEDKVIHVPKTVDLETSPITVKLCHADLNVITKEKNFLYDLETLYSDLLYTNNEKIPAVKVKTDIKTILGMIPLNWKTLVVTDKGEYTMKMGKKQKIPRDDDKYDYVIYADASATKVADRFASIMEKIDCLTEDGVIIVVREVYENLPYKSAAVELILCISGCSIEVPLVKFNGAVIGLKE